MRSKYQHFKHIVCFKNIPTQVFVALEISLSKAIVRYRERVFLPDAIHSRNFKAFVAVAKVSYAAF